MDSDDVLDTEIELITSSLLPAEHLEIGDNVNWPRTINITSEDSKLALHIVLDHGYPEKSSVVIEVKGKDVGRDEAEGWKSWVDERMDQWDDSEDYPLFQFLTTHCLPLLAPSSKPSSPVLSSKSKIIETDERPHHVLLTSHHLIAPSKRKDLFSLSSSLSLTGFAKVGHPGIIYAIGHREDLEEWTREVKSWQWLALRVRITPTLIHINEAGEEGERDSKTEVEGGRGKENGARGGKGRGDWTEVEKITEALEWLRDRGKGGDKILLDLGMGGTTTK